LTTFILIGAIMVSIALGLLAWPLFRGRADDGRLAPWAIAVVALALPLGSAAIYHRASNWDWSPAAQQATAGAAAHSIQEMIDKLEARLRQKPDDVDGWLMLGRTEFVRNNFKRSAEAFGEAYRASGGKNLEAVVAYGEALTVSDQTSLRGGKAAALFEDALKMDPVNPKALWYGGMAAAIGGKLELARERWLKLLGQELPADIKTMLADRIREVDQQLGRKDDQELAKLAGAIPPPAAAMAGMPGPAQGGGRGAAPAAGGPGTVTVHVKVAAALAARIPPGAPLFVLARDPTQPGPPFAAKRFAGAALPMDVVLTAQDAMMPGRTIKDARQLTIVARFSASGMPQQASGDVYGEVAYDLSSGKPVDLVIDKQVP
jgi:cytochrome c-type biogenesis protein CcmH